VCCRAAAIGKAAPDRDHLAVGGRIVGGASEIASARDNRAVAHDHRSEREIGVASLIERHAHETHVLVGSGSGRLRNGDRRHDRGTGKPGDERSSAWPDRRASACAGDLTFHVTPLLPPTSGTADDIGFKEAASMAATVRSRQPALGEGGGPRNGARDAQRALHNRAQRCIAIPKTPAAKFC
jgi:hypothetical protein